VEPGGGIGRDDGRGEAVETDLDRLITRRHDRRVIDEGERPAEEAWRESERRHEEQRRVRARYEWHLHHTEQTDRLRRTLEILMPGSGPKTRRERSPCRTRLRGHGIPRGHPEETGPSSSARGEWASRIRPVSETHAGFSRRGYGGADHGHE
jgi:hypothetical protein